MALPGAGAGAGAGMGTAVPLGMTTVLVPVAPMVSCRSEMLGLYPARSLVVVAYYVIGWPRK